MESLACACQERNAMRQGDISDFKHWGSIFVGTLVHVPRLPPAIRPGVLSGTCRPYSQELCHQSIAPPHRASSVKSLLASMEMTHVCMPSGVVD